MSYIIAFYLFCLGTFLALTIAMIIFRGLPDRLMTVWGFCAVITIAVPTIWAFQTGIVWGR